MATITAFIRSSAEKKDREVNIRFRLTDGRKVQLFYKSPLAIIPRVWSNETQSIKAKVAYNEQERLVFNRKVEDTKHQILEWYIAQPLKTELTSADLQAYMDCPNATQVPTNDFTALYMRFMADRDCGENRKEQLRVGMRDVQRFEAYIAVTSGQRYAFDIHTATPQLLRSFERFLADEHKIAEQYPELYANRWRKQKPRGYNTIRNRLIYLRSFYLWLRENEITTNNPFKGYKIKKAVYGSAIYITVEELHHLAKADILPRLERYRDLYLFQASIGCRVSDLHLISGANVANDCVEYIAQKTSKSNPKTVVVPMNNLAKAIYEKYRKSDPNEPLFPKFDDQVYNRNIKKIFEAAGLDRWVQRRNPTSGLPEQVRLCDIVATHMARKTFIGNIFEREKDQNLVSELTGHRPNSEAFLAYRDVNAKMKRAMVAHLDVDE